MGPGSMIFYYHRLNRYSFNALAGALDSDPDLAEMSIHLARTREELHTAAASVLHRQDRALIALSVLTIQFREIRNLVRQLRSDHGRRVTILAGGPHATADPQGTLQSGVDVVFRGEAEMIFPEVLKKLSEGEEIGDLDGVSFHQNGGMIIHPRSHPVHIDAFYSISPGRKMFGPIEITRGCPFTCSYCQTSHLFGVRPRHRSVAGIVRQAAALCSRNRRVVRLLSPNAFSYGSPDGRQLNLTAMQELLVALHETVSTYGKIIFGYFPSEVRPEHVTPETLELLRQYADNDEIVIGAQSGSKRMLDACRRSHSVEDVLIAVSRARKAGYKVIVDFIFGLPGESAQDVRETVAVMSELARLGARIHPHAFAPLPQTAFSAKPCGKIPTEIIRALEQLAQRRAIYGDWTLSDGRAPAL
jgi:B12-binding domain/radical SAM domain protein